MTVILYMVCFSIAGGAAPRPKTEVSDPPGGESHTNAGACSAQRQGGLREVAKSETKTYQKEVEKQGDSRPAFRCRDLVRLAHPSGNSSQMLFEGMLTVIGSVCYISIQQQ
ncbi:hypothetical protein ABH15_09065 [Methanoculleus taiwanensis]|uniref:Uncharacterized protein n=1 Tax=Methanoculleus taiwanensis TaxID=1550565 RepID=A0A498H024_9EURY|nr:hypothetical protein ABH15_09065 [Methanoculleus taiwanensis]